MQLQTHDTSKSKTERQKTIITRNFKKKSNGKNKALNSYPFPRVLIKKDVKMGGRGLITQLMLGKDMKYQIQVYGTAERDGGGLRWGEEAYGNN